MSKSISRRTILKGALSAGAGIAAVSVFTPSMLNAAPIPQKWDETFDVVVVGTGFAGLTAAIEAHDTGAKVLILEKAQVIGGNSMICSGLMNCPDPERQDKQDIKDSPDLFYRQTLAGGDFRGDPEKVRFFADHGLEALKWLEAQGVQFIENVYTAVGALYPRTHEPINKGRGASVINTLKKQADTRKISIKMNTQVTGIVREQPLSGDVLGVEVSEKDGQKKYIKASKAVVLGTGGFGADVANRSKYNPRLDKNVPTTNVPWATMEAITAAEDIGADVVGMDFIQLLVACNYFTRKYGDIANIGVDRAVYINLNGERFVAEDSRRDVLAAGAIAQPEKVFLWVGDDETAKRYSDERIQQALDKDLCFKADTLEGLAKICQDKLSVPADKFVASVKKYNDFVKAGEDKDFNKSPVNLKPVEKGPFFASPTQAGVHHTMGGLRTKGITGQVLDRYAKVIPRLYAAGECTGGVHGTNRVGANALTDCFVFGRLAGQNAAKETAKA